MSLLCAKKIGIYIIFVFYEEKKDKYSIHKTRQSECKNIKLFPFLFSWILKVRRVELELDMKVLSSDDHDNVTTLVNLVTDENTSWLYA